MNNKYILGIETSCDETSVSLVDFNMNVYKLIIFSQIPIHQKTSGIVPEIAAREHAIKIYDTLSKLFYKSKINYNQIEKIAVTKEPGLIGSLLVGLTSAEIISILLKKEIVYVNHIYGHIASNWLDRNISEFKDKIICLTASGGHNDLYFIKKNGNKKEIQIKKLGSTLDDASGECFDKVAKMLNLGYPGGPLISKYANTGNENAIKLPKAMINTNNYNFSFSGIKNACRLWIEKNYIPASKEKKIKILPDFCASLQYTISEIFIAKLLKALKQYNAKEIHIAGGVSSNEYIKNKIKNFCGKNKLAFKAPIKSDYSTDNGAMIAGFAILSTKYKIKFT